MPAASQTRRFKMERLHETSSESSLTSTDELPSFTFAHTGLPQSSSHRHPRRVATLVGGVASVPISQRYIWDFVTWGFSTPHCLEQFSSVEEPAKAVVPLTDMDQGRLFVRVSIKDLATLQLAYKKGLTSLQKAKAQIAELTAENNRLDSMVKSWTSRTSALTNESQLLRQQINNIRLEMQNGAIQPDEHQPLLNFICRKICVMFDEEQPTINAGLSFDDCVQLIASLPSQLQEQLAQLCPKFKLFIYHKDSSLYINLHIQDVKLSVQHLLDLLPVSHELHVLNSLLKDFHNRHGSCSSSPTTVSEDRYSRRRFSLPQNEKTTPVRMTVAQSRENNNLSISTTALEYGYDNNLKMFRLAEVIPRKHPKYQDKEGTSVTPTKDTGNGRFKSGEPKQPDESQCVPLLESDLIALKKGNIASTNSHIKQYSSSSPADESKSSILTFSAAPLAQSTPCGTLSHLNVSNRVDKVMMPSPTSKTKNRKKAKSKTRWFLCGAPSSMSESESLDRITVLSVKPPVKEKRSSAKRNRIIRIFHPK